MPTELEELVEFLHHGNTQIRQIAVENLVPYSKTQPSIFSASQLTPVKDLKLLIRDYAPIAKNALTILINISSDAEVLKCLAEDDAFLESVLLRVTNPKNTTADDYSMLLANLSKSPSLARLVTLRRASIPALSPSPLVFDQLIDLFNIGANGKYNPAATFDYLAYVFADLAKYPSISQHVLTPPSHEPLPPLTKLLPSTTHPALPRRIGITLLLKNLTLTTTPSQSLSLLQPPISILPFLLLPLCAPHSPSSFTDEEVDKMLPELQYLGPEQQRESDLRVLAGILEVLYLLVAKGEREAKETIRAGGTYYVVRELHLSVEDENVREGCERLVQILMQEEGEGSEFITEGSQAGMLTENLKDAKPGGKMDDVDDDDDDRIVEIF